MIGVGWMMKSSSMSSRALNVKRSGLFAPAGTGGNTMFTAPAKVRGGVGTKASERPITDSRPSMRSQTYFR